MPGMSGDRLALAIKETVPSQPVVMITAFAEVLPKPLSAVDMIISKPFLLENLREAIAKACPTPPHSRVHPAGEIRLRARWRARRSTPKPTRRRCCSSQSR